MYYDFWYFQSIEYEDVHDKASKGVQGEGAVKFSIHIEEDDEWNHKYIFSIDFENREWSWKWTSVLFKLNKKT